MCIVSLNAMEAQPDLSSRVSEVIEKITVSLSQNLKGQSRSQPLLVLIGGYVGSGKTTLSKALQEKYDMTVFSLNAIRQAMLNEGIDIRSNKQEERKVLFAVYPRLLAPCIASQQHIVIDANANRQGIQGLLNFYRKTGAECLSSC